MRARTGATRSQAARSRGRLAAVALSLAAHVLLLGWFALRRDAERPLAEAPAVMVQLVRVPRPPRQAQNEPPTPSAGRPAPAPRESTVPPRVTPMAPVPGSGVSRPGGVDLNGPVFADGRWPRPEPLLRNRCDPAKDPARLSPACRREDEIARAVTAANDPRNGQDALAVEGRRKEALRRFRETIGGEDPTLVCSLLHRC